MKFTLDEGMLALESSGIAFGKIMSARQASSASPARIALLLGIALALMAWAFFYTGEKPSRAPAGISGQETDRRTEEATAEAPVERRERAEITGAEERIRSEIYDTPEFEALPGWLPLFPTASRAGVEDYSLRSDGLSEGKIGFLLKGDEDELLEWYGERLAEHGMTQGEDGRYASDDRNRACEVALKPASQGFHRIEVGFSDQGEGCACPTCGGEGD